MLGQLYDSSRLPDPSLCVELVKTWVLFFQHVTPENQTAMLNILVPIFVAITPTAGLVWEHRPSRFWHFY